jgi:hypothetical protein
MNTNLDKIIDSASQLIISVQGLNNAMRRCERKERTAHYLFRGVYAMAYRDLEQEAVATEQICLEAARAIALEIARLSKVPGQLQLSQNQMTDLREFLEMCKRPMFPILNHRNGSVFQAQAPMRDC